MLLYLHLQTLTRTRQDLYLTQKVLFVTCRRYREHAVLLKKWHKWRSELPSFSLSGNDFFEIFFFQCFGHLFTIVLWLLVYIYLRWRFKHFFPCLKSLYIYTIFSVHSLLLIFLWEFCAFGTF